MTSELRQKDKGASLGQVRYVFATEEYQRKMLIGCEYMHTQVTHLCTCMHTSVYTFAHMHAYGYTHTGLKYKRKVLG